MCRVRPLAALLALLMLAPGQNAARSQTTAGPSFDPHDLDGTWRGDLVGNRRWDNQTPEPPLTEWGLRNLLYESISHDPLAGTLVDPKRVYTASARDSEHSFFLTDQNGVRANDPNGEYPGKDCEPLAVPAMYDYPSIGSMEFLTTREGDRMFQLVEYHREWRTIWLSKEHPKDPDPTYMGHSVAHWEGGTLVVDTVGFNGKSMISGVVGHRKSEDFRLVERFRRVDHDHLQLEMTYYDPKAWGDKAWSGFRKSFKLVPKEDFQEFICSPREYQQYEAAVSGPLNAPKR